MLRLCGLPLLIKVGADCVGGDCPLAAPRAASLLQVEAGRHKERDNDAQIRVSERQSMQDMTPYELLQLAERAAEGSLQPNATEPDTFWVEIQAAVNRLLGGVVGSVQSEQSRLDNASRQLRDCGRIQGGGNKEGVKVNERHRAHDTCRYEESDLQTDMSNKCTELHTFAESMGATPTHPDTNAGGTVVHKWRAFFQITKPIFDENYHTFIRLDEACLKATESHTTRRNLCNQKQSAYEASVCMYVESGGGAGGFASCMDKHIDLYNGTIQDVAAAEEKRIVTYAILKRIICYVSANGKGESITEATHECHTLEVDTSPVKVDYPGWPLMPKDMDSSKMYPCGKVWASYAYGHLPENANETACTKCPTLPDLDGSGNVFIRWGALSCPDTSELVYEGIAAGSGHGQSGNGANLLCLVENPTDAPASDNGNNNHAILYGVQYQDMYAGTNVNNKDAGCAACAFSGATYTMWGSTECKQGHVELYSGNVMSSHHGHQKSEWVCVDSERRAHFKSDNGDHEGIKWYLAEYDCGSLPCGSGQFDDSMEVACAVCGIPDASDAVYTRWGHDSCPGGDDNLVYTGAVGGANYAQAGGGYNTMCLTLEPKAAPANKDGAQNHARVYGAEYQDHYVGVNHHDKDAACAVCKFAGKTTYSTWGTTKCGHSHTQLYEGNVVGGHHGHYKDEWVCLDPERKTHAASNNADHNGVLWYLAEYECGSLPCGPFTGDKEVACAVCGVLDDAGSVFTRWGHLECPAKSTEVYQGVVGGANQGHRGGGANALCLSMNPTDAPSTNTGNNNHAMIYGSEYEDAYAGAPAHTNWDAGCVVCAYEGSASYDIWGTTTCPDKHEVLYTGNVLAAHHGHHKQNYACFDKERQERTGGDRGSQDGVRWYTAEYECGSIPCGPYNTNKEVACARCGIPSLDNGMKPRCVDYDNKANCPRGRCSWIAGQCRESCAVFSTNTSCPSECVWYEEAGLCEEKCQDHATVSECPVERCMWSNMGCNPFSKMRSARTLLMKLKAGSDVFKYDSAHWENDQLVNEADDQEDESDDADVKTAAFLSQALTGVEVCYGTLENCFEYQLGQEYASARELFSAGWLESRNMGSGDLPEDDAKRAFTDVFLPPGCAEYDYFWTGGHGVGCKMQRPGINTKCADNNWARIGYCTNLPGQGCQPADGHDADSPIGIGLKTQNAPNNVNAPFGEYFIHGRQFVPYQKQAWLFALN